MNPEPALLVIAPLAEGFDLTHFPWSQAATERISVNSAKFSELDMLEVIVDGMPFLLSRFTTVAIDEISHQSAIGVTPRGILTSGQHLPEIIHRILLLGKWIGDSLAATTVALMPSGDIVSFEYFDEVVKDYLTGKPLPSSFLGAFPDA